ncbi:fibronectin type III domain-containing protein [Paenibacillus tyrfis]|uniref:fibronectin type III domain-containing protein n=1 Tax=Paenibacillus tyrfis TaxID=1501230 RepID=UPI0020A04CAB|nr:fibronectin type III domain-containing protein [Paenibacillus tyrfis]MCP1310834.1 fibronectin type III domain-containing protein [Paenibacillus tyrfis]
MTNRRYFNSFPGKLWVWGIAIMMVSVTLFTYPVQAVEQWSQYAKIGRGSNDIAGAFSRPSGLTVDGSGNLYVADTSNNRIQKLTAATGMWSEWGKGSGAFGTSLGEFSNPTSVAVDRSGNVYVADRENHRVQKLTVATGVWSEWKSGDGRSGSGLGEFKNPNGVAVDSSGNVYVADTGNHRIQKLTAATGVWSEWKSSGGGSGSGLGEFSGPARVSVDSSDNVYVADTGNHRIQKLTAATGVWSEWKRSGGGSGSGLGEFSNPSEVAIDGSGNIYVADAGNHRIQKLTIATGVWSEWKRSAGGAGSGLGEFNNPKGVAVDGSGNVYVADSNNERVQKLDISSNSWSEWIYIGGVIGKGLGEFKYPNGVAVDSSGNVYVAADYGNHRIQKLDASTRVWSEWGKSNGQFGSGLGEFDGPTDVAVDSSGNVYVSDFYNHRVQKLTVATGAWSEWKKSGGGAGSGLGQFNYPSGVAVDGDGNVYVADSGNNRIQRLTSATGVWSEWKKSGGGAGNGLGEFDYPTDVAVDRSGNVYVADMNNHRIQKLTVATGGWSEWKKSGGGAGNGLGEFAEPYHLAVNGDGNVYVADSNNHRIQKLTAATGKWSEWKRRGGGAGGGLGEFYSPLGVAVGSSGNVYVADSSNHRVQKLEGENTPPDAPTNVTAEVANGESQATIKFTAPVSDGGSAITGYTVTSSPGGLTASGTGSPITVTGLTYGTAYTFTVVATNDLGNSTASLPSNSVTPTASTAPGAPTHVTAEVANGESQATIKFTAPVSNGGSPITGYTVTSSPGGLTASGTGSPITVTGLTYGTAYTFTVVATNGVGNSKASLPSNSVTPTASTAPATVPGAPTAVTAVVEHGQSQATVTFTPPASNGGSTITGYIVTASPGGLTASGTGSPITVTGLTYGTTYTFTVVAINGVGSSASSVPSNRVTLTAPATVPGAPTNVKAVAGNGEATVTFTPPASHGGSPIESYTVIASPGGRTATGTGSPITVTGLTNGVTYTFTVIATNSIGSGAAADVSNAVRPEGSSDSGSSDNTPSSGGTSSQPAPAAASESDKTGAVVLVNGQSVNAGTVKVTTVDLRKVTTVTLDQNKLEERLAKEGKSAVVTIPVNTASDVVIGELNGQMVSRMEAQQAVLEIKTDKAAYRIPARQINIQSISNQVGKAPALQDIKVQIEIAVPKTPVPSPEGTIAIVAPPLDFAVRATYKDKTVEVTEFQAYVERTMAIPDGVDPNKITTGVAIETDGTLRHVPTKVVLSNGKYYAKINSLTNSVYSVIWHPLAFKDVERYWAEQAVNDMGSRLVVSGVGQGAFHPDQDITRAEFAAILIRGLGLKAKEGAQPFSDVERKDWFAGAVGTAYAYNLIGGFEDGTFRPNEKITREQAMTILARAMTITGLGAKSSPTAEPLLNSFADAGTVSDWAKSGISDALQSGLLSGRSGTELAPKAFITRAEVAVIVQRLLQKSDLI